MCQFVVLVSKRVHCFILIFYSIVFKRKKLIQLFLKHIIYYLRVFENRILRRIFGPKRNANGKWRRVHNEEPHSLYRSPNTVRATKFRRLIWAGDVVRMEGSRSSFKILAGKPTGGDVQEGLSVDGRTKLESNLKKWLSIRGIGLTWLRMGIIGALVNAALKLRVP